MQKRISFAHCILIYCIIIHYKYAHAHTHARTPTPTRHTLAPTHTHRARTHAHAHEKKTALIAQSKIIIACLFIASIRIGLCGSAAHSVGINNDSNTMRSGHHTRVANVFLQGGVFVLFEHSGCKRRHTWENSMRKGPL